MTAPSIRAYRDPTTRAVRTHLRRLLRTGWLIEEIADESRIPAGLLLHILDGGQLVTGAAAHKVLTVEIPPRCDVDDVVVERLIDAYPTRIWDQIGATRAERITAAEQLDESSFDTRAHFDGAGFSPHQINVASRARIDACLSLRAGRDYGTRRTRRHSALREAG